MFPLLVAIATLVAGASAWAGPLDVIWLQPERLSAPVGALVMVQALKADAFEGSGESILPTRLASVGGQLGSDSLTMALLPVTNAVARYLPLLQHPGVAVVRVALKPEARSISRSSVEEYMRALHVTDEVRAAWNQIEPPSPWVEVRTMALKSFIRVGEPPPADRGWESVVDSGIDVVPEQDPTMLDQNGRLAIRVLRDGRPYGGAVVEYLSRGETRQHVLIADEEGRVSAVLNAKGEWLIRCFDVRRSAARNHDWDVTGSVMSVTTR